MANVLKGLVNLVKHPIKEAKFAFDVSRGKIKPKDIGGEHQRMMNEFTVPILGDNKLAKNSDAVAAIVVASIFTGGAAGGAAAGASGGTAGGAAAGGAAAGTAGAGAAAGTAAATAGTTGATTAAATTAAYAPTTAFGASAASAGAGSAAGAGMSTAGLSASTGLSAAQLGAAGASTSTAGLSAAGTGLGSAGVGWGGSAAGQGGLAAQAGSSSWLTTVGQYGKYLNTAGTALNTMSKMQGGQEHQARPYKSGFSMDSQRNTNLDSTLKTASMSGAPNTDILKQGMGKKGSLEEIIQQLEKYK